MKKIMISLLLFAATCNAFATETARVEIKVKSSDNKSCTIDLIQDDAVTTGAATGSAEMNMTGRQVAFYAMTGGYKYEIYLTKELGELPFGLKTNGSTDYTLSVISASGETMTMYDGADGSTFALTAGASKAFTATANSTIEDRFHLFVSAAPSICHRYGKLQVYGSNGMTVKVLNMDGSATSIADTNITSNLEVDIDLAGLAAGQYKVEWNSQTLIIDVK